MEFSKIIFSHARHIPKLRPGLCLVITSQRTAEQGHFKGRRSMGLIHFGSQCTPAVAAFVKSYSSQMNLMLGKQKTGLQFIFDTGLISWDVVLQPKPNRRGVDFAGLRNMNRLKLHTDMLIARVLPIKLMLLLLRHCQHFFNRLVCFC